MWIYDQLNKRTTKLLNSFNILHKNITKNDLITFAIFNNCIIYMFTHNGHLFKIDFKFTNKQWIAYMNVYIDIYAVEDECFYRKTMVVEKLFTTIEKIDEIVNTIPKDVSF